VDAISADDAWAVGTIPGHPWHAIIKHWDGTAWSPVKPNGVGGPGNHALFGISAVSSSDIWAVGRTYLPSGNNRTIIEHWDGMQWSVVKAPKAQVSDALYAVDAIGSDDVWAVGSAADGSGLNPLIEHWDGRSWKRVTSPAAPNFELDGVSASGPDDVWAVGSDAYVPTHVLAEHWDGTSWTVSDRSGTSHDAWLQGVVAFSPSDVRAVGGSVDGSLVDNWDGSRWAKRYGVAGVDSGLEGVDGSASGDIWAVGGSTRPVAVHWDGSSWKAFSVATPHSRYAYFNSVSTPSSDDAWAVGLYRAGPRYCLINHWDGKKWSLVPA
jgi:hypothetical protein